MLTRCPKRGPKLAMQVAAACGLVVASGAFAQYKYVGPDGRITYSDRPPPADAKVLQDKKAPAAPPAIPLPFEIQQAVSRYPVTLYSGNNCPPCDDARGYLRRRGVPYAERTVTTGEDTALFKQQSPDGTAPIVTVGARRVVGWSESQLSALLDSAGYPASNALPAGYQNAPPTPLAPPPAPSATAAAAPASRPAPTPPPAPPAAASPSAPPGFRF